MKDSIEQALCRTAKAISEMFGRNCETVVHDFSDSECRLVAIFNSHVSGRTKDSTESIYGVTISSSDIKQLVPDRDYTNTVVYTRDGRKIKATSVNFIGPGYHYVLGINFDITPISAASELFADLSRGDMEFADTDLASLRIEEIFDQCLACTGKPAEQLSYSERLQLITILSDSGVFSLQKAVPYVAARLGVTRYTVYNYLKRIRPEGEPRDL